MKKTIILLLIFILSSCSSYELNKENIEKTYIIENRSLNLQNKNIKWFVNLNIFMSETEVNNIFIQNNNIDTINISDFKDLWTLDVSNNNIRFISDLKLPFKIRSLNLSWNKLTSLKWLEKYKFLKKIDISNNNLKEKDIIFKSFKYLKYINVIWNDISKEFTQKIDRFNSLFLSNNLVPFK